MIPRVLPLVCCGCGKLKLPSLWRWIWSWYWARKLARHFRTSAGWIPLSSGYYPACYEKELAKAGLK